MVQSPICYKHLFSYMHVSLPIFLMHKKMPSSSHNTIMEKVRGRSSINICFAEAEWSINQFWTQEPCGVLRMLHSSVQCGAGAGWSSVGHIKLNYSENKHTESHEQCNACNIIYIYDNRWSREKIQLDFNWILNFAPLVLTKTQKKKKIN